MRKNEPSQADSLPEPEQDPGQVRLEDLDQHIAERINQLGDPPTPDEAPVEEPPTSGVKAPPALEQTPDRFVSGFEAFDVFDYASEHRADSLRATYREVSQGYQETAELMRNIHDLADLVTGERAAQLDKSISDIRNAVKEQQRLLKEANDRLTTQSAAPVSEKSLGQILIELEKQNSFLESRIERSSADVKHKLDEQREAIWSQFGSKFNAFEKESRDYLNRSLFSLAVLVVAITFVAGALIVNTMDKVGNYITQSVDTLRVHLDQVNNQRQPPHGHHTGGFSR